MNKVFTWLSDLVLGFVLFTVFTLGLAVGVWVIASFAVWEFLLIDQSFLWFVVRFCVIISFIMAVTFASAPPQTYGDE